MPRSKEQMMATVIDAGVIAVIRAPSADVLLPIVDFGYADEWKPVVSANGVQSWGWWLRILRGVEIVLGWLFGGALAAMLAQLIKKE